MAIDYIDRITQRYEHLGYRPYRWNRAEDPPPWHPLDRPLAEARLGLLSTAGAYVPGQPGFFYRDDTSLRRIPRDTPSANVHFAHLTEHYLADPRRDPDCIFPARALERLEDEGTVGTLVDEHLSCMGGIYSQRRVREELAPAVLDAFRDQAVEAALLVPM